MSLRLTFQRIIFAICSVLIFNHIGFTQSVAAKIEKPDGDTPVIKTQTQIVTFTATVIDKMNRPIPGLARDNFEIYEDKIKQNIEYFTETDIPVSVGIVFDTTGNCQS